MPTKEEVFESLLTDCQISLQRFALHLTSHTEDAKDLMQQTIEQAYRGFENFRPGSNFRSWIFQAMLNAHRNNYRKKKRELEVVSYDLDIKVDGEGEKSVSRHDSVLIDYRHPERIVLGRLPEIELERALNDLPKGFKLTLLLHDIKELSYLEIARALKIPLGTVRSRINRTRIKLRKALQTSGAG